MDSISSKRARPRTKTILPGKRPRWGTQPPSLVSNCTSAQEKVTPISYKKSAATQAVPCAGNHLFAALPHYNNPQGTFASPAYLFEAETPLNASKTLQSVTLPSSVSQGQLYVFMIGTRTRENYPYIVGTSDDSDTGFANLDGANNSYSIEALEAATPNGLSDGQPFTFNGVTFT